jgi:GxxExxY protein
MNLNNLSSQIIKAAVAVHKELGPGLLESVYQRSLAMELGNMGLKIQCEVSVKVFYRGMIVWPDFSS